MFSQKKEQKQAIPGAFVSNVTDVTWTRNNDLNGLILPLQINS